jgi:hypothetical protein
MPNLTRRKKLVDNVETNLREPQEDLNLATSNNHENNTVITMQIESNKIIFKHRKIKTQDLWTI